MNVAPTTDHGVELWGLLPEVYRTRDGSSQPATGDPRGDLARYLDVFGDLLDQIRATLEQRFADGFPDETDDPEWPVGASQTWLLPYFADLLDVTLRSPHTEGRRREISNAIAVRQRKGTLRSAELMAESVVGRLEPGQESGLRGVEVEIQEGWRRVARTHLVSTPLLPLAAFGAVDTDVASPSASPLTAARHPGLPAVTVDFRRWSRAVQCNPEHPLVHRSTFGTTDVFTWRHAVPRGAPCFPESYEDVSMRTVDMRDPSWDRGRYHPKRVLVFVSPHYGLFDPSDPPREDLPANTAAPGDLISGQKLRRLTLASGDVHLEDCAIDELVVSSGSPVDLEPVLDARRCLFGSVQVVGRARFEYCTVLGDTVVGQLEASDSIFAGELTVRDGHECVRFSRIPPSFTPVATPYRCTTEEPLFQTLEYCEGETHVTTTGAFGEPGSGVLHPASPSSVRLGAEDGGEMGAYHDAGYALEQEAVVDAITETLPVGITPALIPDPRLLIEPPTET